MLELPEPGPSLYDSTIEPDDPDEFTARLGGPLWGYGKVNGLGRLLDGPHLGLLGRSLAVWKTVEDARPLLPRASRVACKVVLCLVTYSVFLSSATVGPVERDFRWGGDDM